MRIMNCLKNGCQWVSRLPYDPKQCPVCHRKDYKLPKLAPGQRNRGNCLYFDIINLDIGAQYVMPFIYTDGVFNRKETERRRASIMRYAYKTGKKFRCQALNNGFLIFKRIA